MITQLRMRHWKSHELTEVSFGKGTNLLVGAMGSGKSSAMDAICFALFGTFPALKGKRLKLADVVMQRPTKYSEASVELWFDAGGANYSVERQVKEGAASAYLRAGGKMMETGSERVTENVEKILKADYELFTRAIYSEQNRIDYFLTLGKGERKKQIDELLGIDRLEAARGNAAALANKLKALKQAEEGFLQGMDWQKVEREVGQTEAEVAGLEKGNSENGKKLAEKAKELENASRTSKELEVAQREHNEASKQLASVQSAVKTGQEIAEAIGRQLSRPYSPLEIEAEKTIAENSLRQLQQAEGQLSVAKAVLDKLEGEKSGAEKRAAALAQFAGLSAEKLFEEEKHNRVALAQAREAAKHAFSATAADSQRETDLEQELRQAAEAEKQLAECTRQAAELREKIAGLGEESAVAAGEKQLTGRLGALNARLVELREMTEALGNAHTACPVCGTALDEEHKKKFLEERAAQMQQASAEASSLQQGLEGERAKLAQLSQAGKALLEIGQKTSFLEPLANRKSVFESEVRAVKERMMQMQQAAAQAEKSASEAEAKLAGIAKQLAGAAEHEAAGKQLGELEARAQAARQEVSRLSQSYSVERKAALEVKLRELEKAREHASMVAKIAEENKNLAVLEAKLKQINFNATELAALRERLLALERENAGLANDLKTGGQRLAEKSRLLAELKQKHEAAKQRLEKVRKLEKKTIGVTKFQEALAETQAMLRTELVQSINGALAELWKTVYPYGDYPALRLSAGEDDYELTLQTIDGSWISVENASGGERACAALSLRISFAVVLAPSLSWLILDEPTHNLDANGVQALARALRDTVPQIVEQVFVITHDEALREAANAKVYRTERDKDRGDKSTMEELVE